MVFNSSSATRTLNRNSEQLFTATSQEGNSVNTSLGGITVAGGDKKSTTNLNANIEFTDFDAVAKGIGLATRSVEENANLVNAVIGVSESSVASANSAAQRAFDIASDNSDGAAADSNRMLILLAGVSVLAIGWAATR